MDNVIQNIKLEDIVPNNYHHQYDIKEIEDLASSIKKHGLLEPITLRKKGNKYELILGNKRYKACIIAGLKQVPAIIKNIDDNRAKEYFMINNDTLVLNNVSTMNSNNNNLDVINLSKLNEEYERDDFKMNTNQFDNNIQLNNNNMTNEPTFGGRFFPSLEDEPTNMNFGVNTTPNQVAPTPEVSQPINNNFIDLTDLNIAPPQQQQMPQNNIIEQQPINNMVQPNFNNIPSMNNQPEPNNNIINLENLKQNSEIGTQPIQGPTNIDNQFQEVINDFAPNNNIMNNQINTQPIDEPVMMNQGININQNLEPMINPIYNQEVISPNNIVTPEPINNIAQPNFNEVQPLNNMEYTNMNDANPIAEPLMQNMGISTDMNIETPITTPTPTVQEIPKKDVSPVINTLKGVAVNLENFGYTIRITDEDLSNSYKITIEVEK